MKQKSLQKYISDMINFNCTEERWQNFIDHIAELAKGNLNNRLEIKHVNDHLETGEAMLNWVTDEWKQRVLQMTFTKPTEAQKFINHFHIVLDKDLAIQCVDTNFLTYMGIEQDDFLLKCMTDYIREGDQKSFLKHLKKLDTPYSINNKAPTIELMEMRFMYSAKQVVPNCGYILNLFQIQMDPKHFRKGLAKEPKEFVRFQQKKMYRDRVADVKKHIDRMPLKEILVLENVCKKYMVNKLQLKKGFRELYQSSAYDYFVKRRMKHAHLLIETSTISLKEISQMVGYAQYSTFSQQFYTTFNIRPKDLRKQKSENRPSETDN